MLHSVKTNVVLDCIYSVRSCRMEMVVSISNSTNSFMYFVFIDTDFVTEHSVSTELFHRILQCVTTWIDSEC